MRTNAKVTMNNWEMGLELQQLFDSKGTGSTSDSESWGLIPASEKSSLGSDEINDDDEKKYGEVDLSEDSEASCGAAGSDFFL